MRYLCSAFIRVVASLVASAVSLLLALSAHAAPTAPPDKFSAKERAQGFSDHLILAKPLARQRATVDAAEARENIRVRDRFARFGDLRVIALAPDESASDAVARLRATGRYEFVEPDYLMTAQIIPNDPGFPSQWGLSNTGLQLTGSTASADIKAIPAWDILHDAPNVIVAVIDNGVRLFPSWSLRSEKCGPCCDNVAMGAAHNEVVPPERSTSTMLPSSMRCARSSSASAAPRARTWVRSALLILASCRAHS